jgi:NADH-quinone oxidoreductase subunit J
MVDAIVFIVSAIIVLTGAVGVIVSRHPVRAALSLIMSFFGVAVLFVIQEAHFLALVQVIVYAGAIVVLFLFVIMLLGVDTSEDITVEPLAGQRMAAVGLGVGVLALVLAGLFLSGPGDERGSVALTGTETRTGSLEVPNGGGDVDLLADDLFSRNLLAFQATALLLTIATIGAVVMVRNRGAEDLVVDEPGTSTG